ncbi:hypothetical protein P0D72_10940 [Paraburkholderia sediminicola]|uniref:hypothetical protein n=1 Tax=Paraburkholderia sediminicola TaxID=458836 RepID=UPI0038BE0649
MTRTFLLHDRLAPPGNHDANLEVLDPRPRNGHIKVFDADKLEDRYVSVESVLSDLDVGKLTVLRSGKPRFSHAAQPDDAALHKRSSFLLDIMRRIKAIEKQRGLSFLQACKLVEEAYNREASPESPPFRRNRRCIGTGSATWLGFRCFAGTVTRATARLVIPRKSSTQYVMPPTSIFLCRCPGIPVSLWSLARLAA